MDAAQALFLDKGFAATSVDEIVRAADVAKGTFYVYFQTKDDVLSALQARFIDSFCERLDKAIADRAPDDWHGSLDAWLETGVHGYLEQVELHDLVFHRSHPSHRQMKHGNPVTIRLAALLNEGGRHGAWTVDDPQLTAVMIFNALHGAVDDNIVTSERMTTERLADLVKAFCRRALDIKP